MSVGIILLAAGESRRLGTPKQLIAWQGQPLLRRMAGIALAADLGPVVVVLGAVDRPCREALEGLAVEIVVNPAWATGMGSSIAAGVACLSGHPEVSSALVMLCDQPHVTAALLRKLAVKAAEDGGGIVACRYHGQLGPPALFAADRLAALAKLQGKGGAKSLILAEPSPGWIDAPEAGFDIDTPADLAAGAALQFTDFHRAE